MTGGVPGTQGTGRAAEKQHVTEKEIGTTLESWWHSNFWLGWWDIGTKTQEGLVWRSKQSTREEVVSFQAVCLIACRGTTQMEVLVTTPTGKARRMDEVCSVTKAVEILLGSSALAETYCLVQWLTNATVFDAKPRVSHLTPSDTHHFLYFVLPCWFQIHWYYLAPTHSFQTRTGPDSNSAVSTKSRCHQLGDECLPCPCSTAQNITGISFPHVWQSTQYEINPNPALGIVPSQAGWGTRGPLELPTHLISWAWSLFCVYGAVGWHERPPARHRVAAGQGTVTQRAR